MGPAAVDLPLLRAAVEASGEAILITSADLEEPRPRIVYANPAFTLMTGYEAVEVVGRSPRLLQGPGTDRSSSIACGPPSKPASAFRARR
ncbi:PAS domain-containing protein [Methylorubrum extorquens]|uniref:PAS domain-containing protein n=1 Tax=Methylorubrum extorquens TaxID=408 RepID=UPI0024782341|nr:PAS domain-containing protein [Methylorubrum extorquens]